MANKAPVIANIAPAERLSATGVIDNPNATPAASGCSVSVVTIKKAAIPIATPPLTITGER